jgi:glyoxylase-like metal-dependent hydrolase (beta-lactamase superfamily II)/rhodanese-related sulfurtransferase
MKVEQLYTDCLAEAAYYIESNGEAVVIDPMREPHPYLSLAEKDGSKIKYVFETHFHADFVSGHIDLSKKTGAQIVYGPTAQPGFDCIVAEDNQVFKIGDVTITVLHTPGHTMESSTYLLKDENGKDYAIFSGDTLFLGDVGRPDLAVKTTLTRADLAGHLFNSLRTRIMPLADDVIVYPGHGAGSACGKKMSAETWGYLGDQKKTNYALRPDMTKEEFVVEVTTGLAAPPQYFPKNAVLNKGGYGSLDDTIERGMKPMSVRAFKAAWDGENALVLDTRSKDEFPKGFIPGSMFIGLDGKFAQYVGDLIIDLKTPILIVSDVGREEETIIRLSRVGYDNPIGYLDGGFNTWKNSGEEVGTLEEITAEELEDNYDKVDVIDVRAASMYNAQHVLGSRNISLKEIENNISEYKNDVKQYLYCNSGFGSIVASSLLMSKGYKNVVNIHHGIEALTQSKVPMTEYVEQGTEL